MKKSEIKIRITLTEEMLGMAAAPDVHEKYIASRAPDAAKISEEIEAIGVDAVIEEKQTVFPKENGIPFVWDYQIKGMFKDACGMLRRVSGSNSSQITSYRKVIDGMMFPYPRKMLMTLPDGAKTGNCQRSLRADTPQGSRIALANSETVPPGTTFEFGVLILEPPVKKGKPTLQDCLIEWLEYGTLRGLHQWRNSGKGKFTFDILDQ
jgi:hypothetical protein